MSGWRIRAGHQRLDKLRYIPDNITMKLRMATDHKLKTVLILSVLLSGTPSPSSAVESTVHTPPPVSGHDVSPETITPADVFARVQLIRKELDVLRFEMGKPAGREREVGLLVEQATPHEVFFQARTMEQKMTRLVGELTGTESTVDDQLTPRNIQPFHSWKIADRVLHQIQILKLALDVHAQNSEALPDPNTTPTQVFFLIGLANQQLNRLLTHQFTPYDVIGQVTLGIRYLSGLLHLFPGASIVPTFPDLEHGREPWDVYYRLTECYSELGAIARTSQVKMLTLATQNLDRPNIQPNDVYDLATLIVSELAYLHGHLPEAELPPIATPPRPVVPSHVYQQAGGLQSLLKELRNLVQIRPQWLHE